jgi:hypothetical protein
MYKICNLQPTLRGCVRLLMRQHDGKIHLAFFATREAEGGLLAWTHGDLGTLAVVPHHVATQHPDRVAAQHLAARNPCKHSAHNRISFRPFMRSSVATTDMSGCIHSAIACSEWGKELDGEMCHCANTVRTSVSDSTPLCAVQWPRLKSRTVYILRQHAPSGERKCVTEACLGETYPPCLSVFGPGTSRKHTTTPPRATRALSCRNHDWALFPLRKIWIK